MGNQGGEIKKKTENCKDKCEGKVLNRGGGVKKGLYIYSLV